MEIPALAHWQIESTALAYPPLHWHIGNPVIAHRKSCTGIESPALALKVLHCHKESPALAAHGWVLSQCCKWRILPWHISSPELAHIESSTSTCRGRSRNPTPPSCWHGRNRRHLQFSFPQQAKCCLDLFRKFCKLPQFCSNHYCVNKIHCYT